MQQQSTIGDVAALAGVSIKTVSRVINREPNVSEKTRDKVLEVAKSLNYRPSRSARMLAGSRSYMIALLYFNLSPSYLMDVQSGLLTMCDRRDYGLALKPVDYHQDGFIESLKGWLRYSKIDGVILTPPLGSNRALIDTLAGLGIGAVALSETTVPGLPAVSVDEVAAARALTRHLIDAGYRDIGFIKGDGDHQSANLRYQGFLQEMAAHGLGVDEARIVEGDYSYDGGLRAAQALLSAGSKPEAVFAANDDMAAAVLTLAHEMGLNLPRDLAVVGFDNAPLAEQVWPPLTTVHQPIKKMAKLAAEKLIERLNRTEHDEQQQQADHTLLPFEIHIRASTGSR